MKNGIPETIQDWIKLLKYSPVFQCNKQRNILNPHLLSENKIDKEEFKRLCMLHQKKNRVIQKMKTEDSPEELRKLSNKATDIEFELQETWGFPKNIDYHRFWELPKCSCPKMDNEDAWPTGYYVRTSNCIIHGTDRI